MGLGDLGWAGVESQGRRESCLTSPDVPASQGARISGAEVGLDASELHFGLFSWEAPRKEMMDQVFREQ